MINDLRYDDHSGAPYIISGIWSISCYVCFELFYRYVYNAVLFCNLIVTLLEYFY
jgi:hypothetical protein